MSDSEEEDILFLQKAVLMRLNKKNPKINDKNFGSVKSFVIEKKVALPTL